MLLRLLHERGDVKPVGYGLTRHGGLHLSVHRDDVTVKPFGTPTPRFVVRRGKVVEADAMPLLP